MYKLVRQYDEEQKGGASLEEGKGAKGDAVDNHGHVEVGNSAALLCCVVMSYIPLK